MKSKLFKYFFVVFAVATMIFAVIKINRDEKSNPSQNSDRQEQTETIIKELKLGIAAFDSTNPILSNNKNVQDVTKLIFNPLITVTSDYKAENCLAQEWAKQNATTYIIKLKEDVKWSDGEEFTADDVKFTIDKLKETQSIYTSNVEKVAAVEVVDTHTIQITLSEEVPFFEYNLTFPILSGKYYETRAFTSDIVPIGTGMYKFTEVQDSSLVLEKNEYYWRR